MDRPAAPARRGTAVSTWTVAAAIAGAAMAAALLLHSGLGSVATLLAHAGWGVLAIVALHGVQLWLTGMAWGALIPRRAPPRAYLALLRMIREGINTLLPVAQIGGLVVAARLLWRGGVAPAQAAAATIVDVHVEMLTQVVFTLLGLAFLVRVLGALPLAVPLLSGVALLCAMVVALTVAQRAGFTRLAARAAERFGWARDIAGLREAIAAVRARPAALAASATCHLLAWGLGAVEVCVALHFLGRDIGLGEGLAIESLAQTIRLAGFAVPAALGVQEGGYLVLCGLFGIGPDIALALSLLKRLRELALGAPSLALWLRLERRPVAV